MCFTNFLLCKKKSFQELLDKLLKKEKDQIRSIEEQIEKILVKLIPLQRESITNPEKKSDYNIQVSEKTSELVQQIMRLNEQIAFIESLIQKLALSPVEITGDEQTFLIRLFLASKLSVPDSIVSILDEYLKNIWLMSNMILLSLYRYIRVHFWLQHFVVRVFLFGIFQEKDFYETTTYSGIVTFNVKSEKKGECKEIMEELIDDAKKKSIQYRDTFQSMISALEFEELKSDFLKFSAQFAKLISGFSSIDDFIFNGEKDSDSLNSLLDSLLVFESKFISEKEKFTVFDREFHTFLKKTEDTLEAIFEMHSDSETSRFGDSHELWGRYKYDQPFADIKALIEMIKSVLFKKCEKDCDCKTRTSSYYYRPQQIVHKLIVLTPEMELKIDQCSAELPKFLE